MSSSKLKEALDNCLINFDRRVLVTDLLEEYALPYQEVNQTLEQYINQQEKKGTKYEKRFLLQGVEQNSDNEVYTVVQGEAKLQEWLQKLKNSESSLYSVEVSGGGKAAAEIFKPMSRCANEVKGLEKRNLGKKANGSVNGSAAAPSSAPVKQVEAKKTNAVSAVFGKKASEAGTSSSTLAAGKGKKTAPEVKKPSPEIKKSPPEAKKSTEDKKPVKAANTKGIGNFFAPVGAKASKAKDKDTKAIAIKPPTPKKMQDFFKKQTEKKSPIKAEVKKQANTSVQLFTEEDEDNDKEAAEEVSSDEEDKLEALKRDIITSDQEDDDAAPSTSRNKRRRIIDSDDDEDEAPQQKQEKKESEDIMVVDDDDDEEQEAKAKPKSETYLDDDGFVITIKPKKSNVIVKSKAKISPPAKKSPPLKKSPLKSKSKSLKSETPASAPKTKQGNIMSFFTKK